MSSKQELQALIDNPNVDEIYINSPHEVFVVRGGVKYSVGSAELRSERDIRAAVADLLYSAGVTIDPRAPFIDEVVDGYRINVVPWDASKGMAVTIVKAHVEV